MIDPTKVVRTSNCLPARHQQMAPAHPGIIEDEVAARMPADHETERANTNGRAARSDGEPLDLTHQASFVDSLGWCNPPSWVADT